MKQGSEDGRKHSGYQGRRIFEGKGSWAGWAPSLGLQRLNSSQLRTKLALEKSFDVASVQNSRRRQAGTRDGGVDVVDGLLQFFRRCCRVAHPLACRPPDESRQAGRVRSVRAWATPHVPMYLGTCMAPAAWCECRPAAAVGQVHADKVRAFELSHCYLRHGLLDLLNIGLMLA